MNTITIGNDQRLLSDADPQWITQQIQGRRKDGLSVCLVIQIQEGDLNISLSNPSGGGGGRGPNARERAVLDLWSDSGLNDADFSPGAVISFLRRLRNLL